MEPVVTTFQALINNVGDFVTASVTWVGQWATKIATTDLLVLSCVAIFVAHWPTQVTEAVTKSPTLLMSAWKVVTTGSM